MKARVLPLGLILVLVVALGLVRCSAGYVLRSAWHEAELLGSRVPVRKIRADGRLSARQLRALDVIEDVRRFGREIGLGSTRNYETVAWRFRRPIWNVTACAPLSFSPKTWWFPVVGRVPYLGYFSQEEARAAAGKLAQAGYDVYLREAGAFSTLGWFRDPILPAMLDWGELALADTVLHELAHANVWVRGGVAFNESFASFVGEEGALRYLESRHGRDSETYRQARAELEDEQLWQEVQYRLYLELEGVYADAGKTDDAKGERKTAILAELPSWVAAASFHDPARYARAARGGVWNNARLVLFQTYHSERPQFERLLARSGGDLPRFLDEIRGIAARGEPFAELRRRAQE